MQRRSSSSPSISKTTPHDVAAHVRYRVWPHLYRPGKENVVRLLYGPTGGGCAMTWRKLYDLVGSSPHDKGRTFHPEDSAYIARAEKVCSLAAVLRDRRTTHAGRRFYAPSTPEKDAYWGTVHRHTRSRNGVQRLLLALPFARRLNVRFHWIEGPVGQRGLVASTGLP